MKIYKKRSIRDSLKAATYWLPALALFGALALPCHQAAAQGSPLDAIFDATDSDGNGLISESEWHAAMQKRMEAIDANHDSNLSRDEFQQAKNTLRDRWRGRTLRSQ